MAIVDYVEVGFPGTLECPPIRMRVPVYDVLPEAGVEGQLAGLRRDGQDEAFVWWGDSWTAPGTSCDCGGRWVQTSASHEANWGTHRDRAGGPALPAPG